MGNEDLLGSDVLYVLENGHIRPAKVVRDWKQSNGLVQLQVFTDGANDGFKVSHLIRIGDQETVLSLDQNIVWRTSVLYDEEKKIGTWHWPVGREK